MWERSDCIYTIRGNICTYGQNDIAEWKSCAGDSNRRKWVEIKSQGKLGYIHREDFDENFSEISLNIG